MRVYGEGLCERVKGQLQNAKSHQWGKVSSVSWVPPPVFIFLLDLRGEGGVPAKKNLAFFAVTPGLVRPLGH